MRAGGLEPRGDKILIEDVVACGYCEVGGGRAFSAVVPERSNLITPASGAPRTPRGAIP